MAEVNWKEIYKELTTPFPSTIIKERVMSYNNDKSAGMLAKYVDVRAVTEKLDKAVGSQNWTFSWELIDPQALAVKGRLTILGVTKEDVGYPNKGPEDPKPLKAAVSDALKRASVQFGVGRDLYDEETRWVTVNERGFPIKDNQGEYIEVERQVSVGRGPRKTQEELMKNLGMNEKQVAPKCGQCGSQMVLRKGTRGAFWGCSNYPDCKNLYNLTDVELDGTVPKEQAADQSFGQTDFDTEPPAGKEVDTSDIPF
jgi:hypothetical protein